MKRRLIAPLLAALLGLSACTAPQADNRPGFSDSDFPSVTQLTLPESTVTPALSARANAGMTQFGVDLLRRTRTVGKSVLISPLSAVLALSMTANGAGGDTLAEFETMLGAGLPDLNANAAQLMADYAALGGSTRTGIANSLWADEDTVFYDQFLSGCAGYRPGIFTADLEADAAREAVNQWINDQTEGMIPEMLEENLGDAAALLINAVYLQNAWVSPFEAENTRTGTFYLAGGSETELDFMHQTCRLPYFSAEGVSGALLRCDDGRLAFAVLLPDGELDEFLDGLDGAVLTTLLSSARDTQVALSLPRFSAQWNGDLTEPLCAMGLDAAFDPGRADFSNMGEQAGDLFYIKRVFHSTCLEVDENGSTAAAATIVQADPSSAPGSPQSLNLNRPFLYAIWDTEAEIPLFLGTFEGT